MPIFRPALPAILLTAALAGTVFAAAPDKSDNKIQVAPSTPLAPIAVAWPTSAAPVERMTSTMAPTMAAATTPLTLFKAPVNMKLLILSGDGTEPGFTALKYFLDYMALPYDAVVLKTTPLPVLNDSLNGFYQGIIVTTGSLGYTNSSNAWVSALDATGWTKLDNYMRTYGVRMVSYYTYPEARYGMAAGPAIATTDAAPASLAFASASSTIFPYLVRTNPLKVVNSYMYLAVAAPALGETTTPILTTNNQPTGVLHTKADGREYMAFTFDNNPYLIHSLALNYGIFNWVTKGIFLGERRLYLTPQNDDYFLANDLFATSPAACKPPGFVVDPTFDPAADCATDRMDGGDVSALVNWQKSLQGTAQTKDFRVTHAFNGFGTTTDGGALKKDTLISETKSQRNQFFWLNHTWDHENLDCYNPVPNSGICVAATNDESLSELQDNIDLAKSLGLPLDSASMVTPNISGLANVNFLRAAQAVGIKYLVSDTSRPDWLPTAPNTGVRSPYVSSILYIPRRATNIYYNTKSGLVGAQGSLPDEYNYFYGPNGIFRIGGIAGGAPFFPTTQTYAQIVDRESNTYLGYILRYEVYPLMFHQSNFIRYNGSNSLFTDVMTATFTKLAKISNLPVASISQTAIGQAMEARMAANAAGLRATYVPYQGITLTGQGTATARITGVCSTGCTQYGGQNISFIPVKAGGTVHVPVQ